MRYGVRKKESTEPKARKNAGAEYLNPSPATKRCVDWEKYSE